MGRKSSCKYNYMRTPDSHAPFSNRFSCETHSGTVQEVIPMSLFIQENLYLILIWKNAATVISFIEVHFIERNQMLVRTYEIGDCVDVKVNDSIHKATRACRTSSNMAAPVVFVTSPNVPSASKSTNTYCDM